MDDIRTEVVSGKYTDDENSDAFSEYQGTILWPRRSFLYRISFLSLMPLYVVFLLGFSSPFWMKRHQVDKHRGHYNHIDKVDVSIGLWRVCEGSDFSDIKDCTPYPNTTSWALDIGHGSTARQSSVCTLFGSVAQCCVINVGHVPLIANRIAYAHGHGNFIDYMACQSMMCLALIFATFSIIFGLYENFATMYETEEGTEAKTKWPEMNAIASGVFGLVGVGMYGVLIIEIARGGDGSVHWAFPVATVSVTGFIVCGILMAIANPIQAQTQSYPGQIMNLSRQNSLRLREPSMQDRLVVINDGSVQQAQSPSTLYGMAGGNAEGRENQFLPRSESCLSSHMSSPDLFTASSQAAAGFPHAQRGTHVVETHEAYVSSYDAARRQNVKQLIQNKAAQRRSWHFDDRSGAYIVSDLINTRHVVSPTTDAMGVRENEAVKPPVPPRRDKMALQPNLSRPSKNTHLQAIPDENVDLMVLDDPVVMAPNTPEPDQSATPPLMEKQAAQPKKNTNPFLTEDLDPQCAQPSNLTAGNQDFARQDSWENQPWPDPPSEAEILEHVAPGKGVSVAAAPVSQSNSVPESLQYQPQNQSGITRKQGRSATEGGDRVSPKNEPPPAPHRSKHSDGQHKRKPNLKHSPAPESHVPVMKEYDNPLFKSPVTDDRSSNHFNEDFSLKVCSSTSFINPTPQPPPSYFTVVDNVQGDTASHRRHSSHYNYSPKLDNREDVQLTKRPVSFENGQDLPSGYAGQANKNHGESPKKRSKAKSKSSAQQNGTAKTRPRQVKREHNQRRSGHPEGANTLQHKKPQSPHGGSNFGSSPDLVSKSPKAGRRELANNISSNGLSYEDSNRNFTGRTHSTTIDYRASPYGYDSNRKSPYYASSPVSQYHWGDSDL